MCTSKLGTQVSASLHGSGAGVHSGIYPSCLTSFRVACRRGRRKNSGRPFAIHHQSPPSITIPHLPLIIPRVKSRTSHPTMSSRGLTSLLAVPSALRQVLLQAALTAPVPPSALLAPARSTQSQSRPYSKKATPARKAIPRKNTAPSKKTTTSKKTKITQNAPPTKARTPSKAPTPASNATPRKKTAPGKKTVTTSKKTRLTQDAPPSKAPTTPSSLTSPPPTMERPPIEVPPRVLSFLPTRSSNVLLGDAPSKADLARTTALFQHPKFLYSAPRFLHLPINTRMPEVCILGRSNVGKSTLINALAGYGGKKAGTVHGSVNTRKGLAITSAKAGCTKTMNAYGMGPPLSVKPLSRQEQEAKKAAGRGRGDRRAKGNGVIKPESMPQHSMVLMDMPGYGLNSRADWGEEIVKYLGRREILHGAVLLIDAVAGVKEGDRTVLELLRDIGLKTSIVLTKADKLVTVPDPVLWQTSTELKQACLHIWDEIRQVEKQGESDWFEGDGWMPEIFVTGAGDPKMGGMGVDGARLAICRLAGRVAQPVQKVEMAPQPDIVPFDQLVFSTSSSMPKYEVPPMENAREDRVPVGRRRGQLGRVQRGTQKSADPMKLMEAAIMQPKRGKQLGSASF